MVLTFKPARLPSSADLHGTACAGPSGSGPPLRRMQMPEPYAPPTPQAAPQSQAEELPAPAAPVPQPAHGNSSPPRSNQNPQAVAFRSPRRRQPIVRCRSIWLRPYICRMPGRWSSPLRRTASNWRRRSFNVPRSCGCRTSTRASTTTITKAPTSQPTGDMITDTKSYFAAGAGATLDFGITDAIFLPLAARQLLSAREFDLEAARNDALAAVATAYFDVQEARGRLAGNLDARPRRKTSKNRSRG